MQMPNVATDVTDAKNQLQYRVMAYRKVSAEDARKAIALHRQNTKKKDKPGMLITIITTIGLND